MLRTIGLAEQELHQVKNILQAIEKEREFTEQQTGIKPPLEDDIQTYVDAVIKEVHNAEGRQRRETKTGAAPA